MSARLNCGDRIGPYHVIRHLATGGEGDSYEVRAAGERLVLKQHHLCIADPNNAGDLERVRRLRHLIGKQCPYVCEIKDVLEQGGHICVVMEHVEGQALEALLITRGALSLEAFQPIARDVLAGLAWLHDLAVVHRDVKPGNIMVREAHDGRFTAKLIDLDIALHRRLARVTHRSLGVGTYPYAPPEVIQGRDADIDVRADLYSFGATMFEALTGRLPFDAMSLDALIRRVCDPARPSLRDHNPGISIDLDRYVQHLMALHPADRPASAKEAWTLLNTLVGAGGTEDQADLVLAPLPRAIRPGAAALAAASVPPVDTPRLLIASGELAGAQIVIPPEGISLGRFQINPGDSRISRFHVRAMPSGTGLLLRDLGSANGLVVKQRRRRKAHLTHGDEIVLGNTVLQYL